MVEEGSEMTRILFRRLCVTMVVIVLGAGVTFAQETVDVTVPISATFFVTDVSLSTTGSPNPTTVSFSNAGLSSGNALRISVQADAADFTPPAGNAIPASKISWTTSNPQGGIGSNGTLISTAFTQLYQSNTDPTSGSVDATWTLDAPGSGIRAGNHTLTLRWKFESVAP